VLHPKREIMDYIKKEVPPEYEKRLKYAIVLCDEIGAIFECPDHPDVLISLFEFSNISELVEQILEKDPDALKEFSDKSEMTRYIEAAIECAEEECSICTKIYSNGN
jgi:hypothetical protein